MIVQCRTSKAGALGAWRYYRPPFRIRSVAGSRPGRLSCRCAEMADDTPASLPQDAAVLAGTAVPAASSPQSSLAGERAEASPRGSLTNESTGPLRKSKSKLAAVSSKVLLTVRMLARKASGAHRCTETPRGSRISRRTAARGAIRAAEAVRARLRACSRIARDPADDPSCTYAAGVRR